MPAWVIPAIAAAVSAAGTAVSVRAQNKAARREKDAILAGIQRQSRFQEQADKTVQDRLTEFNPETRERNEQAHGDAILERLNAGLDQTREGGAGQLGQGVEGQVTGNAFKVAQANASGRQAQNAAELARLLSRVGGAQRFRQDEQIGNADLATQLSLIGGNARQAAQTDELRRQQAGRVGVNSQILSGGLRALGAGIGAWGGGGGSAAPRGEFTGGGLSTLST